MPTVRFAISSLSFMIYAGPSRCPPFCRSTTRSATRCPQPTQPRASHHTRDRRSSAADPQRGTLRAHTPGGHLLVLALARPARLRSPGPASTLSRLGNDSRGQRPVEFADTQTVGQRATQPHQRLQLRRSSRTVRRSERFTQEKFCHRLFLSLPAHTPAATVARLDQPTVPFVVSPGRHLQP